MLTSSSHNQLGLGGKVSLKKVLVMQIDQDVAIVSSLTKFN